MVKLSAVYNRIHSYLKETKGMESMFNQVQTLVYMCLGGEGIISDMELYGKLKKCYNHPQFKNYKKAVDNCLDYVEKAYKGEKIYYNFSKIVPTEVVVRNARLDLLGKLNVEEETF